MGVLLAMLVFVTWIRKVLPMKKEEGYTALARRFSPRPYSPSTVVHCLHEAITFKDDSHMLTDEGREAVRNIAGILERLPPMTVSIEGHSGCKCAGTCTGQDMSKQRALSVKQAL